MNKKQREKQMDEDDAGMKKHTFQEKKSQDDSGKRQQRNLTRILTKLGNSSQFRERLFLQTREDTTFMRDTRERLARCYL
jgi:hypothetical protein